MAHAVQLVRRSYHVEPADETACKECHLRLSFALVRSNRRTRTALHQRRPVSIPTQLVLSECSTAPHGRPALYSCRIQRRVMSSNIASIATASRKSPDRNDARAAIRSTTAITDRNCRHRIVTVSGDSGRIDRVPRQLRRSLPLRHITQSWVYLQVFEHLLNRYTVPRFGTR